MKFIVIEGLDGSGKSTQVKKLRDYFNGNNMPHEYLHFPRTDAPYYGELVAMFLRGDFGDINDVNPYLVAMLYAGDRNDAKQMIKSWLKDGKYVLVDRYVISNIAFQCAKIKSREDKEKLSSWIKGLEYDYHALPKPDINLFLDVPFSFTSEKLSNTRDGEDRDYLQGKKDIHEESLDFQMAVRETYLNEEKVDKTFHKINCFDQSDKMLPPDVIFEKVVHRLKAENIF